MNSRPTMSKRISQLIGVEGGDSWGISVTGETPQGAKRLRRLTARPPERVRLERKSTVAGGHVVCRLFISFNTEWVILLIKSELSPY